MKNTWISGAQFAIQYKEYVPPVEETTAVTTTEPSTTEPATTTAAETKGCGSVIATAVPFSTIIATASVAAIARKKKNRR